MSDTVTPDERAPVPPWLFLFSRLTAGPMFVNDNAAARHHTPLLAIGPNRCRFIVSDSTRDAICCGAPTQSDLSSWCADHARVVYEPRLTATGRGRKAA
jgi:hypothetical protein